MLLNILDGAGVPQRVIVHGQEAIVDRSGTITVTGTAQTAIAANALRSGWFIQNLSVTNPMYVNDLGAAAVGGSSFKVPAGGTFPPEGYPVSTGAISIIGTAADQFAAREW